MAEIVAELNREAPDVPASLLVVFVSPDAATGIDEIAKSLWEQLQPAAMIGCTGGSLVADGKEIEEGACISAWSAWMPEANLELMHVEYDRSSGDFEGIGERFQTSGSMETTLLTLGEPYSFPADVFLDKVNKQHAGALVVGGMASGGTQPGECKLIFNGEVKDEGAVVVGIENAEVVQVVSQGCRPIGEPFVITKAEQNVILELGGKKAHQQLKATYDRLPTRDKELMRLGIHLGRVVNEYQDKFEYGDFLIRNVTGMNSDDESILIGDYFRPGQTVQFHVRDAMTADEDLTQMLIDFKSRCEEPPKAALLFTCNGRGSRFFENPNHDAEAIQGCLGELPAAGFFCQGEIGPVSNVNFLHGFTASTAFFF